jgi:peptide/nickel transport system permease protein
VKPRSGRRRAGIVLLCVLAAPIVLAPVLAPNAHDVQFRDRAYAPPMRIHVRDVNGFRAPFVYRQQLADRLSRRYDEDRSAALPLQWFRNGRVLSLDDSQGPLLILGADPLGRDVFARLLNGAWLSLGVVIVGAVGALAIGTFAGGLAGTAGGRVETLLMLAADFLIALPGAYLVLVLRGVLPPVLSPGQIFLLMAALFTIAGWPHVARGVRAIVAAERTRAYAEASRAAGAGLGRQARGLVPAARGFLGVEAALLVPALLVAEVTISFLGLGFPEPSASWGTMLQDVANVRVMTEAPWMLAPAVALFLVVLGVQLAAGADAPASVLHLEDAPGLTQARGVAGVPVP